MRGTLKLACSLVFLCTSTLGFGAFNTVPDGNRHPALGSTCIQAVQGDPWLCLPGSGFLVAPQIAIGVAHMGPWLDSVKPAHVGMTFDEKIGSPSRVYEVEQIFYDPLFSADNPDMQDPHDLAVMILKEPVVGIQPLMLPPVLGFLDKGNVAGTYLTLVDRGLTTLVGWPNFPAWGDRRYGTLVISDLRTGAIMLSPDQKRPVQVCYGGSASAALFTNSNTVVGVGSMFSDWTSDCQGPSGFTRLDTIQARNFLALYLPENLLPK
jgi:hypothetical protein